MQSYKEKSVEDFIVIARAFCVWAESPPNDQDEDFKIALGILPQLYLSAIVLRESGGDESEVKDIPNDLIRAVYHRFSKLPFNAYGECFDPHIVPPEEPSIGSLVDDLGDIYHDVKRGLQHFDAGFTEQAIWHWQFHFRHHWGRHLVNALRALHCHAEANFLWPHGHPDENR